MVIELPALPGLDDALAVVINASGQIVGWSQRSRGGGRYAWLWTNDRLLPLDPLPGDTESEVTAINDAGQAVGKSSREGSKRNISRAVLWQDGKVIELPRPPGLNDDDFTHATGINNHGQVVGFAPKHALLWQDGQVIDLGDLPRIE